MPTESHIFVAVGHDGTRLTSPDGATWTEAARGKEGEVFRAVAFGGGRCVAVGTYGGKNLFSSSADGKTWTFGSKDGKYNRTLRGLAYGKGQFVTAGGDPVSVGQSSPFVMLSTDGVEWTDYIEIAGKNIIRRIAWGNDCFVGVGDRGRRSFSPDARSWTDVPNMKAVDTLIDIAYGNGIFVGVGLHGLRMTTKDGQTWSERMAGNEGEHLNSIVWANDRFVAVGAGATYISPDGVKWESKANEDAPTTLAHHAGVFIGCAWRGRIMVSKDAVNWTLAHQAKSPIEAVGVGEMGNG